MASAASNLTTTPASSTSSADEHSYSTSTAALEALSPKERRFRGLKIKCERLKFYILHRGKCPPGLTKSESRNLRNQGKVHAYDRDSQVLYYTGGKRDVKKKVVTDTDEVNKILDHYHLNEGSGQCRHSGINGTLSKISQHYTWQGMKEDVTAYVSACDSCKGTERSRTKAPHSQATTAKLKLTQALQMVGMDVIGPLPTLDEGWKYILAFTDFYSKFIDLFPLKTAEASDLAACVKTFIYRWGVPKRLVLNRQENFISQLNFEVCKVLNAPGVVVSNPPHPQIATLRERANQDLTSHLRILVGQHQDDWVDFVDGLAHSLRTAEQPETKSSPFFLMFGRRPRLLSELESSDELLGEGSQEDSYISNQDDLNSSRIGTDLFERSNRGRDEDIQNRWKGTCLESACQILQTTSEFECLKYRNESTEDNDYMIITRVGTFGVVGLPTDLASMTLDRHGKLTFQAVYQQAIEHRLFDGEAFDAATFCCQLRRLVKVRFCRGIPGSHIADNDLQSIKTLGYPTLRYQSDKCQVFYEQSGSTEGSRTPYRCVSCKYAIKFLAKKNKIVRPQATTQIRKELKRPVPTNDLYSNISPRGQTTWINADKDKRQQPGNMVHVQSAPVGPRPHPGVGLTSDNCQDLRDIVQAIHNECDMDLDAVFNTPPGVHNIREKPREPW